MDNIIVTGAVIAFLLLILPAVIVPFLNQNPSTMDTAPRVAPDPISSRTQMPEVAQQPDERLAA